MNLDQKLNDKNFQAILRNFSSWENVPAAIIVFSLSGHFLYWNAQAAECLHLPTFPALHFPEMNSSFDFDLTFEGAFCIAGHNRGQRSWDELRKKCLNQVKNKVNESVKLKALNLAHVSDKNKNQVFQMQLGAYEFQGEFQDKEERSYVVVGILNNITSNLQAHQQQESFFQRIVEQMPIGLYVWQLENPEDLGSLRMLAANEASAKFTGVKVEILVGKTMGENFPALLETEIPEIYRQVIKTNRPQNMGEVVYGDDNISLSVFWVQAFPLPNQCVGVAFENITESYKAKKNLHYGEKGLRKITEYLGEVYWVQESYPEEKLIYVSPAFERIWGVSLAEVYEDPRVWMKYVHPEEREKIQDVFERWRENPGPLPFDAEYRIVRPDGEIRWIHDRANFYFDGPHTRISGIAKDITRRKNEEAERKELVQELEKALKMKDEFLSIAAHELRTPLTPLKLHYQGLQRLLSKGKFELVTPEKLEWFLKSSEQQIQRLHRLVENLLDVSRVNLGTLTLNKEMIDLSELVTKTVFLCRLPAQQAKCFLWLDAPEPVKGFFDYLRIEQILVNLIHNAIKYAPGRPIHIHLHKENSPKGGSMAVLKVKDEGPGIPEQDVQRIFHRYERLAPDSNVGGLGLGLFIGHQIVSAHGGQIRVESQIGKGSTFIVELPLEGAERGREGERK